jgi:hypothetical protein
VPARGDAHRIGAQCQHGASGGVVRRLVRALRRGARVSRRDPRPDSKQRARAEAALANKAKKQVDSWVSHVRCIG